MRQFSSAGKASGFGAVFGLLELNVETVEDAEDGLEVALDDVLGAVPAGNPHGPQKVVGQHNVGQTLLVGLGLVAVLEERDEVA